MINIFDLISQPHIFHIFFQILKMENVMSNESYDTVIIQEKNTMEVNPAKLTMTEFGLAAMIESTENEAEKIHYRKCSHLSKKYEP